MLVATGTIVIEMTTCVAGGGGGRARESKVFAANCVCNGKEECSYFEPKGKERNNAARQVVFLCLLCCGRLF